MASSLRWNLIVFTVQVAGKATINLVPYPVISLAMRLAALEIAGTDWLTVGDSRVAYIWLYFCIWLEILYHSLLHGSYAQDSPYTHRLSAVILCHNSRNIDVTGERALGLKTQYLAKKAVCPHSMESSISLLTWQKGSFVENNAADSNDKFMQILVFSPFYLFYLCSLQLIFMSG